MNNNQKKQLLSSAKKFQISNPKINLINFYEKLRLKVKKM
jgi:hypothetical protein